MKHFKKLITAATIAGVLGVTGAAYAVGAMTPAGIAAELTGKSAGEVTTLRADGTTYGTTYGAIASEAGKLDEFKARMLEQKKIVLDQRVKEGRLTQEQADQIYTSMETNQANCDATGSARLGKENGVGFGQGMGKGMGRNNGEGLGERVGERLGSGVGMGRGMNK